MSPTAQVSYSSLDKFRKKLTVKIHFKLYQTLREYSKKHLEIERLLNRQTNSQKTTHIDIISLYSWRY